MALNIDNIVKEAQKQRASDIHLVTGYPIVFRIFGKLKRVSANALKSEELNSLLNVLCTPKQKAEFEKMHDLDFGITVLGSRIRVNAHLQREAPGFSMRLINSQIPTIDGLGLPSVVKTFSDMSQGLILVTGPTGSGKSTSMAAMIRHIVSNRNEHIVTVEDPIEYDLLTLKTEKPSIIEQREVGPDTPSFSSALKHVLRQDPDVILIGEMRDYETVSIALTAAETGHLVISTLHTLDACQSIDRMIDVFPPNQQEQARSQLSLSLVGIMSQRILPRANGQGAVAAMEIMVATSAVRNLIRTMKTAEIYSMIELGKEYGMKSLDDSIEELLMNNIVSYDACRSHIKKVERFDQYASGSNRLNAA